MPMSHLSIMYVVEVEFSPIKKVIIHEIIKDDYKEFIDLFNQPGNRTDIRWVEGVLFHFESTPKTPDIVRDQINGIIHWDVLNFTKMEKFQNEIKHPKHGAILQILNNSTNTVTVEIIKWLKKQPLWTHKVIFK